MDPSIRPGARNPVPNSDQAGLFVVGEITEEAADFLAQVHSLGVGLSEGGPGPLVVLITDASAPRPPEELLRGREVLPVTFLDEFPAILPELSHLAPRKLGAVAARRLAFALRYGGQTILDWERLGDRAVAWERTKDSHLLLAADEQPGALALLQSAASVASPSRAPVARRFVLASREHSRRRRRTGLAVLALGSALLAGGASIAVIQGIEAVVAGDRSVAAADEADARRLVGYASDMIGIDPDLPLIFAARASELAEGQPAVVDAVGNVVSTSVAHRSIPLDTLPSRVSAASTAGTIAITSVLDDVVRVYDNFGKELNRFHYAVADEGEGARLSVSPDGTHIAVATVELLQVFDSMSGQLVRTEDWAAGEHLLGWLDDDAVMVGGAGQVLELSVASGETRVLLAGLPESAIRAASASPDGRVLAVSNLDSVFVWNRDSRSVIAERDVDGATDVAVADGGEVALAARFPHLQMLRFAGEERGSDEDAADDATVEVEALDGGYFAAADRNGSVALYSAHGAAQPLIRFRGHLDGRVSLASLPNGDIATVGQDRYLRIWRTAELSQLGGFTQLGVQGDTATPALTEDVATTDFPPATLRAQIRVTAAGAVAVVAGEAFAGIVEIADPQETTESSFGGVFSRSFLSSDGSRLVIANPNTETISIYVTERGRTWKTEPERRVSHALPFVANGAGMGVILPAVDGRGATLAVATATELLVWDKGALHPEGTPFASASNPLAVAAYSDGKAAVVTVDGLLHRPGQQDLDLAALVTHEAGPSTTIVAAEFGDRHLFLLTDSGAVFRLLAASGSRALAPVVPAGSVMGEGALRLSRDASLVAHVSRAGVEVIRVDDGAILLRTTTKAGLPFSDVDFADDSRSVVLISSIGTITSLPINADGNIDAPLVPPRSLTESERLAFNIGDD